MKIATVMARAAAALLVLAPAYGHHSASMFEPVKTVTLTGVVKEFQYTNPHSWLIVYVPKADGTGTVWGFEAEGRARCCGREFVRATSRRGRSSP